MGTLPFKRLVLIEALYRGSRILVHGLWLGAVMFVVGIIGYIQASDLEGLFTALVSVVVGGVGAAGCTVFAKRLPPTWVYRVDVGWRALLYEVQHQHKRKADGEAPSELLDEEYRWRASRGWL